MLPSNVTATTSVAEAIAGARYAVHALPVQHSRAFLTSIKVCLLPCRASQHLLSCIDLLHPGALAVCCFFILLCLACFAFCTQLDQTCVV